MNVKARAGGEEGAAAVEFALIVGVMIHLAMWATIELGLFSAVMLASYLAFLDPFELKRRARGAGLRLTGTSAVPMAQKGPSHGSRRRQ